ncbi:PIF1-like helicase domain containing protein, partial [Elaphomyces granulatus]
VHATFIESEFLEQIYPELALRNAHDDPDFFINRIILSPRDFDVEMLNNILLEKLNSPAHIFNSFDHTNLNHSAWDHDGMTTEYLRTIAVASLPPGALHVRIGCPLMLMRNLDPQHGLRSGARMTLLQAGHRCLEVRLLGGEFDGQSQLIHRQSLSTADNLPFCLTRRQFPVRLAFALNIYKSQGRSFEHVGI